MVLASKVDASLELRDWLEERRQLLEARGVEARLRVSEIASERSAKAGIDLKRGGDLGSMTMWANGMIDLDILRRGSSAPEVATTECAAPGDVVRTLDAYLDKFLDAV